MRSRSWGPAVRDEFLDPGLQSDAEQGDESGLRPRELADFVGQRELKEHLDIVLGAARQRGQAADHILLAGPPGLGKTTLAGIVAAEMGVALHVTSGPALERAGDLASILTKLQEGDVLFIDEIHRLSRTVEEILYPAMEDYQIDIVVGKGPSASSIRLTLPRFTLVGATTRTGMITGPLRDRFGLVARLEYYDDDELCSIVERAAGILDVPLVDSASRQIARRSRGTPRIANALLRRVRDFAQIQGDGTIALSIAQHALKALNVDAHGLDEMDNRILGAIIDKFSGGPVGLNTVATAVGEEAGTIEEVYEPFLIMEGYLQRTPRGRLATERAYRHLGRVPSARPGGLFD
ncbi:MAG: Holliday junction branch migration DNA helicase RuvB [Acidimicrobiales bacterium]